MAKYHISPDGVARPCHASKGDNSRGCRYGYSDAEHYETLSEASIGAEEKMKKENGGSFNKTKNNVKNHMVLKRVYTSKINGVNIKGKFDEDRNAIVLTDDSGKEFDSVIVPENSIENSSDLDKLMNDYVVNNDYHTGLLDMRAAYTRSNGYDCDVIKKTLRSVEQHNTLIGGHPYEQNINVNNGVVNAMIIEPDNINPVVKITTDTWGNGDAPNNVCFNDYGQQQNNINDVEKRLEKMRGYVKDYPHFVNKVNYSVTDAKRLYNDFPDNATSFKDTVAKKPQENKYKELDRVTDDSIKKPVILDTEDVKNSSGDFISKKIASGDFTAMVYRDGDDVKINVNSVSASNMSYDDYKRRVEDFGNVVETAKKVKEDFE